MARFQVDQLVREFRLFLRQDRTWWIVPIALALAGLGFYIAFGEGSALAPFIYSLF